MSLRYPHIAARIFNTPLLIHPLKLQAIVAGLSSRFGLDLAESPQAYTTSAGERSRGGYRVVNGVAVVDIFGVLAHRARMEADSSYVEGYETIARRIANAMADRDVNAIVLNLDTPGGEVSGAFQLADQIRAARAIKPIHAIASDMAASAGYLIASAASSVSITETGEVGSIGVVTCHIDMSGALQKTGYQVTPIFAGAHKIDGNPYQPLPEAVAERIQADINHYYSLFVSAVAKSRPALSPAAIRATEADLYIGEFAVQAGLADRVETPDEMIRRIAAESRKPKNHQSSLAATAARNKKELVVMSDEDVVIGSPEDPENNISPYLPAAAIAELCLAAGEPALGRSLVGRQLTTEQVNARLADAREIRAMASAINLPAEAEALIVNGISLEQAGRLLVGKSAKQDSERVTDGAHSANVVRDERDKFISAGVNALLSRCGAEKHDGANPYRGMRLHEMARASMIQAKADIGGLLPEEFIPLALGSGRRYFAASGHGQSSSDFPIILENTIHKLVLMGFQAQPITWERFCAIGDVTDFREWKRLVPGLIGNLDDVNERGEYLNKNIPDATSNSVQAKRRGNIISVTPEVIINDDLGYIRSLTDSLGRAGPRTIERKVYALIESNPTLSDGIALFHASHNNLASSGAVASVDTLDAAASAMAQQTAPGDDAEYLDIMPAVALVHTGKRGNMLVLVKAEYDPDTANKLQKPNKVNGIVRDVISSPRLSAAPWYLFADPTVAPVIEVVFLNGQREPRIVEDESFRTGGLSWRVELPFGVGAIDFRGGYKNPGA